MLKDTLPPCLKGGGEQKSHVLAKLLSFISSHQGKYGWNNQSIIREVIYHSLFAACYGKPLAQHIHTYRFGMWKGVTNVQWWWAKLMLIFTALQWLLCINSFPLPSYLPPCVHADECSVYLIYIPALAQQRASQLGLLPFSRTEIAQAPGGGHFAMLLCPRVFGCRRACVRGQLQSDAGCVLLHQVFHSECAEWTGGCLAI